MRMPMLSPDASVIDSVAAIIISKHTRYHWAVAQDTDLDMAIIYDYQPNGEHRPTDRDLRGSSEGDRIVWNHWAQPFMDNELSFF
ncbi:unnamed protein product [Dibothriocephalus latus]|uniref:Uncharacterized protein n=1 Tax=Dibothriocephalus latus TaxID=60516 RepID=A0A3P7P7N5_DIBLA|nr:unnamed protein product [Dibothriocephalus latus]